MFGRTPRLPIDVSLGVTFDNGVTQPYTVYAENLSTRLQYAHNLAVQNAQKKAKSNKKGMMPIPLLVLFSLVIAC